MCAIFARDGAHPQQGMKKALSEQKKKPGKPGFSQCYI